MRIGAQNVARSSCFSVGGIASYYKKSARLALQVAVIAGMLYIMITGVEKFGIQKPVAPDDQTLLQNYIEWYGVFYTLTLSFIIGQGWQRYLKANSEIDREADALSLLLRTSEMCSKSHEELRDELVNTVILYINAVKIRTVDDQRADKITVGLMNQVRDYYECTGKSNRHYFRGS